MRLNKNQFVVLLLFLSPLILSPARADAPFPGDFPSEKPHSYVMNGDERETTEINRRVDSGFESLLLGALARQNERREKAEREEKFREKKEKYERQQLFF